MNNGFISSEILGFQQLLVISAHGQRFAPFLHIFLQAITTFSCRVLESEKVKFIENQFLKYTTDFKLAKPSL